MQGDFEEESEGLTGRGVVAIVGCSLALGLLGCMGLGALGNSFWAFDLFNHFYLQYAVLGVLGALVGLALRTRVAVILFLIAAVLASLQLRPFFVAPEQSTHTNTAELRVLALNVLTANNDPEAAINWILSEDADVLVLQETSESWMKRLDLPLRDYERLETDTLRDDNFGISVYVKAKLEVGDVAVLLDPADLPWIDVELRKDGRSLHLFATHTLPPVSGRATRLRDEHLAAIVERAQNTEGPVAVAGDLNASIWSKTLAGILKTKTLRSAGQGHGLQGTWPSVLWFTGMIPIDHVLVSPDVFVTDFHVGDHAGSDHRGVVADLKY